MIRVAIIDDRREEIAEILEEMKNWQNIVCETIIVGFDFLEVPQADIILLDEALGLYSGARVAKKIREENPEAIIASISSARKPFYAQWHFDGKLKMPNNRENFNVFFRELLAEFNKNNV